MALIPADSLLAAFTLPPDPSAPPFVTPRVLPADAPTPSSAVTLRATAPAGSAHGPTRQTQAQASDAATTDRQTDVVMTAHVWQENMRLSQEALTLLRGILADNVLGQSQMRISPLFCCNAHPYKIAPWLGLLPCSMQV